MMLFEPLKVKGLELKNRIVMPPMVVGVGLRGRRARAYYGERARGGVGTIIAGATSVDLFVSDEAWSQAGGVDSFIQGLRSFTNFISGAGSKIGIQLFHGKLFPAGAGAPNDRRGEAVAPSPHEKMRELTIDEIRAIIAKFGIAAANVKEAGFDFVEFHGAHGCLACQFFSPADNNRIDEYGGDLMKRMKFGLDCVGAMRAAVGEDYPIFFRLGAWEDRPRGIALADSIEFAIELEKAGVDVLDVSVGVAENSPHFSAPLKKERMGTYVWLAEGIKKRVSIPVITVGRINSYKVAEASLTQGRADLIAIGRQLIADPFWPRKVVEGRFKEIVACDSCNLSCFGATVGESFGCKVNPRAGREWELPPPE